jgi:hypothetical protein
VSAQIPSGPGKIITFYSYKGGTGRSMALANVAWILASSGFKVLVIDWDLEAPGIHRYFQPFLRDRSLISSEGIIDFVIDFATGAVSPPEQHTSEAAESQPWYSSYANLLGYASSLQWNDFPKPGTLDLVPAGRQDESYAVRVNSFHWQHFYDKLGGGLFLEEVKQRLRAEYDYILIDSRTGVSDTSGICTVQMPDELVVCFTLNRQSIEGAAAAAASALAQRRKPDGSAGLKIWPMPTRVELAEKKRLDSARQRARALFDPVMGHLGIVERERYWGDSEVLYQAFYAYEETLAVFVDEPGQEHSMLSAMEKLATRLTDRKSLPLEPISDKLKRDTLVRFGQRSLAESNAILSSFANQYEEIRRVMPSGPDRTRRLDRLVGRIQSLAGEIEEADAPRKIFSLGLEGFRIVGLALASRSTNTENISIAMDGIRNSRSAFEQYQALLLAEFLLSRLGENARAELADAVSSQLGNSINQQTDVSRWHVAQEIMKGLEEGDWFDRPLSMKALQGRIEALLQAAGFQPGVPSIAFAAAPLTAVVIDSLTVSTGEAVKLLKNLPSIRKDGFGPGPFDAVPLVNAGRQRRGVSTYSEGIELGREGAFLFVARGGEQFLAWPPHTGFAFLINPLVIAEAAYLFCESYRRVLALASPSPASVCYMLEVRHLDVKGEPPQIRPKNAEKTVTGQSGSGTFSFVAPANQDVEITAFQFLREFYLWFGVEEDRIPYVVERPDGRRIDVNAIQRA